MCEKKNDSGDNEQHCEEVEYLQSANDDDDNSSTYSEEFG